MKITVVGAGYVGLTTSAVFAYLGHQVTCVDNNDALIRSLHEGKAPIYEPGLDDLLRQSGAALKFVCGLRTEHLNTDIVLICVGTPAKVNGDADLQYVEHVAVWIGDMLPASADLLVLNKSTVPVGTAQLVESIIKRRLADRAVIAKVTVASAPEFLREGCALRDTLFPERVLIGTNDMHALARVKELYAPILEQRFTLPTGLSRPDEQLRPTFVHTGTASAELAKYAANTFLAMKISFANEIGGLAERVGADVKEVMWAVGLDSRIGRQFLGAGVGWGGSCFGKDTQALQAMGKVNRYEMPLTAATIRVNQRQRQIVIDKLQGALGDFQGRTVALWGITFKPNTDDVRDSPALDIACRLVRLGARVCVYDPMGMERARRAIAPLEFEYADSPITAVTGADAVVLMTEWPIFIQQDWAEVRRQMHAPVLVDARNVLDAHALRTLGFQYFALGR